MLTRAIAAILFAALMIPGVTSMALPPLHRPAHARTDDIWAEVSLAIARVRADLQANAGDSVFREPTCRGRTSRPVHIRRALARCGSMGLMR